MESGLKQSQRQSCCYFSHYSADFTDQTSKQLNPQNTLYSAHGVCSRHFTLTARLSTQPTDLFRSKQSQMNMFFDCRHSICIQCLSRIIWDINEISLEQCFSHRHISLLQCSQSAFWEGFNGHMTWWMCVGRITPYITVIESAETDCRQLNAKSPTNEPLLGNTATL